MKRIFKILLLAFFLPFHAFSTCHYIEYTYDDAGNRTSRSVVDLGCMVIPEDTSKDETISDLPDLEGTGNIEAVAEGSEEPAGDNEGAKDASSEPQSYTSRSGEYTFNLYPNPTRGLVEVEAAHTFMELEGKQVQVFDLAGRELYSQSIDKARFILDFSEYADGQYIVRIVAGRYVHEVKVVKE